MIKVARLMRAHGYITSYRGWPRTKAANTDKPEVFDYSKAILVGGGEANSKLPFIYPIFIIKLFFNLLFSKRLKDKLIYCINFETGFATWLTSYFRRVNYIYDIWDELAMSHNFPRCVVKALNYFDHRIRKRAHTYIHVDKSRYSNVDKGLNNSIILYNSPEDFYKNTIITKDYAKCFAVTGWLNETRGLHSIYNFAKSHQDYKFIVAGKFHDKNIEALYLSLPNVTLYDFMPQAELFKKIENCSGIFSLYDPRIPINKLAASNKLYDAMMLAIPVIVNKGLVAAEFVEENNIGYVVDYDYNQSWEPIVKSSDADIKQMGMKGREIYLSRYEFSSMVDKILLPKIKDIQGPVLTFVNGGG